MRDSVPRKDPDTEVDGAWGAFEPRASDAKTRESEARFSALFNGSPVATLLTHSDRVIVSVNDAFLQMFGVDRADVTGRTLVDLGLASPDEQAALIGELAASGTVHNLECLRKTRSGARRITLYDVIPIESARDPYAITFIRDLTDQRVSEERLLDLDARRQIQRLSVRFFDDAGLPGLLEAILDVAMNITQADFGTIQVLDPQSSNLRTMVTRGLPESWVEFWNHTSLSTGPCGIALGKKDRVIVEDVTQSEIFTGESLDIQLRAGARAVQSTPLIGRTGRPVGVFSTQYRTPRRPSSHELRFLDDLAHQAADLLEKFLAEAALCRSEAKAIGILNSSVNAVIVINEGQQISEWNRAAERIFGYTRAQTVGAQLDMLFAERCRSACRATVARFAVEAVDTTVMDNEDVIGLRQNGEEFPIRATISRFEMDGTRFMTVSVRDVTDLRRREEEERLLADVGGALAALDVNVAVQNFVNVLARSIADLVTLIVVEDGARLRRLAVATRDPKKAWIAKQLMESPLSLHAAHPLWQAVRELRSVVREVNRADYENYAQGPAHLEAVQAAAPKYSLIVPLVVGETGIGVLAASSESRPFDEHQQRLVEEVGRRCALVIERAQLLALEKRASRRRDELLAIVAHDLRNPLHSILLASWLLQRGGPEPERRDLEPVATIRRSAARMSRIIDDLLDIARFEAGTFTVQRARVTPADLVAGALTAQRAQVAERSLKLVSLMDVGLPAVWADFDRILQVFDNLIGNATKFTSSGIISIGARAENSDVVFSVADTGDGIAPDHLPHLFDRFWQARDAREGAGLGLSIVKAIVEAHGGRVWTESQVGIGSTFYFTLPIAPAPEVVAAWEEPTRAGRRILVADDNPDLREALAGVLHREGYAVTTVANGQEVLDHVHRQATPDVILLDLAMPVMDGWAVLEERNRDSVLRSVPVIVISGQPNVEGRAADAGARFIPKPISPERLLTLLREIMARLPAEVAVLS